MRLDRFWKVSLAGLVLAWSGTLFAWSEADYEKYTYRDYDGQAEFQERIDFKNVDYRRISAAVFFETNRQRAKHGKAPFRHSSALERAAERHSRDMVERDFFSHDSPVRGRETMAKRLALEGVSGGYRGENIANTFGIEYAAGRPVYSPVQNGGYFSYSFQGAPIEAHTYAGMGRAVVEQWMDSPGHRANILNEQFAYLGAGSAFYEKKEFFNMPHFMFTQNFGSEVAK